MESRKLLAKTVLVFVGLFAVCWLPSHVVYLYRSYHYGQVHALTLHTYLNPNHYYTHPNSDTYPKLYTPAPYPPQKPQ